MQSCPKCGLLNPDEAQRCDCGYDFLTGTSQKSYLTRGAPKKPPSYVLLAALTTLCFCLPIGIMALIYSSRVDSKWAAGDFEGAKEASDNARNVSLAAIGIGLFLAILSLGVRVMERAGAGS